MTMLTDTVLLMYIILAGLQISVTLFAIFYRRGYIRRDFAVDIVEPEQPSCAVIVATKGLPYQAERNFRAILDQNYPDVSYYFVVESETDSAFSLLCRLTHHQPRAHVIIAGLSQTCSQKIFNMRAGIEAATTVDVLVFADNDIYPSPDWLQNLIAPLASSALTVTSIYTWCIGTRGSWGEHAQTLMNMNAFAFSTVESFFLGHLLQGGSMAIRRQKMLALEVDRHWHKAISDDMSLIALLVRKHQRAYYLPGELVYSDLSSPTMAESIRWFQRQLLNLKLHQYRSWCLLGPVLLMLIPLPYVWLPMAGLLSLWTGDSFWAWGGGTVLIFFLSEFIIGFLYGCIGPTRRHGLFVARIPILRLVQSLAYLKTIGAYTMNWADVCYTFNRRGEVVEIARH
ncbi:hypothetical protein C2W62_31930 [Candidatus Entotheonella serta]|nr:hypothetical protein C2W62_31930 [Candidatus Entotheonella serta]